MTNLQPHYSGAYGDALLVESIGDKKRFVMKTIASRDMSRKEKANALKEVKVMSAMKHRFIVGFVSSFTAANGQMCIVMEHCDGGTLEDEIKSAQASGKQFSEGFVANFLAQCALAFVFVHKNHILHRDLKPANIFLKKTRTGSKEVRVGDFGLGRFLSSSASMGQTVVGTPYYISPEVIDGKPYSYPADVWSFGVMCYELCELKRPFEAENIATLALKIHVGTYEPMESVFSEGLKALIYRMLSKDPENRPSFRQILDHPSVSPHAEAFNKLSRAPSASNRSEGVSVSALPESALIRIFSLLDVQSRVAASSVCVAWSHWAQHPTCWREVDLRFCVSERIADIVSYIARVAPQARKVYINNEYLTDNDLYLLCRMCRDIQYLDLKGCTELGDRSLRVIGRTLRKLRTLVANECCDFGNVGVEALVKGCPRLEELDISDCERLKSKSLSHLCTLEKLTALDLSTCSSLSSDALTTFFTSTQGLKRVCLAYVPKLDDSALNALVRNSGTTLNALDLEGNHRISEEALLSCSVACAALTHINLSGCNVDDDVFLGLISHCRSLESLTLRHCRRISWSSWARLPAAAKELSFLDASFCSGLMLEQLCAIANDLCNSKLKLVLLKGLHHIDESDLLESFAAYEDCHVFYHMGAQELEEEQEYLEEGSTSSESGSSESGSDSSGSSEEDSESSSSSSMYGESDSASSDSEEESSEESTSFGHGDRA